MPLTSEQLRLLTAVVDAKIGDAPCPLCGHGDWSIARDLATITLHQAAGSPYGLPGVAITCTNCGNTHVLHLQTLGLDVHLKPLKR